MARPRRRQQGIFANANISQHDLITWLDVQEQKTFLRVAPIDETVEAFDPLLRGRGDGDFAIPARIEEIFDRGGERGLQGRGGGMRRTIKFRFERGLTKSIVPQMMNKIKQFVHTRHKLNFRYGYETSRLMSILFTIQTTTALRFRDYQKRKLGCKNWKSFASKVKK